MKNVSRYGRLVAQEGCGAQLAELLLEAARALHDVPGCELYLAHRHADAPDGGPAAGRAIPAS